MLELINSFDNTTLIFCATLILIFISTLIFTNHNVIRLKKYVHISNLILFITSLLIITSNNLGNIAILLLWFFVFSYLAKTNLTNSESNKKTTFLTLIFDLACLFATIFLFLEGFIKYFLLNEIPLIIEQIASYTYEINSNSMLLAFIGAIILISRLFGFFPFNFSLNTHCQNLNPLVLSKQKLYEATLGASLLLKTYLIFNQQFELYQNVLIIYFLANTFWFVFTIFKTKNAFKIISTSLSFHFGYGLVGLFCFNEITIASFVYFCIILILSHLLIALIFANLCNNFKTTDITAFKAIGDKTKIVQIYTMLGLINLLKIAPFGLFVPNVIICANLFCAQFDDILNTTIYLIMLSLLLFAISIINLIHKLISNIQNDKLDFQFKKSEFLILTLIIFVIIGLCVYPQYFFNEFIAIEGF
ncbi:MAG: hypothetical protein IJD57_00230 [Candidatus Gastranaerophilales bacterium]|nr:hypothetical protein [Candidatus Gastranaerophilales bacterium]